MSQDTTQNVTDSNTLNGMPFRQLGNSGLKVPLLSFGTGTFGGQGDFFKAWGSTDVDEAKKLIDICLEHGVNLFDSADGYSGGAAEEILGRAIRGRRDDVLVSTKGTFRSEDNPNGDGSGRYHLIRTVEGSLKRLGTDHIDLYQLHGFDHETPIEETLMTLGDLVKAGKIRYFGGSNFSGWQMMKALAASDRLGLPRHVAHQAYYALSGRDFEHELMPLGIDQGVGTVVWSPLGWGKLTGKIRRGQPVPENSRSASQTSNDAGPQVEMEYLYDVVDALDEVAKEVEASIPQVALAWLLTRPTVSTIVIGARNEEQLRDNLACVDVKLTEEHLAKLDKASWRPLPYPYWHQSGFPRGSVVFKEPGDR